MRRFWLALGLCALITSTTAIAGNNINQDNLKNRAYWNPITIYNHASYNIAYMIFASGFNNQSYMIRSNSSDIYHPIRVVLLIKVHILIYRIRTHIQEVFSSFVENTYLASR